jgi:ribosome-associated translation inhibitor RaiA
VTTSDPTATDAIRIDNALERPIPRTHVRERLAEALRRAPLPSADARATFTDVNGPKGGLDVRCAVQVRLPGRPAIVVSRRGTTPRLAFDAACDRVLRTVEGARERFQDSRRRPRKYFAAKRLLVG